MRIRIYIFCFEKTHAQKKISTSKFIHTNLPFICLETIKDSGLCFSTKKNAVRIVFLNANFV